MTPISYINLTLGDHFEEYVYLQNELVGRIKRQPGNKYKYIYKNTNDGITFDSLNECRTWIEYGDTA